MKSVTVLFALPMEARSFLRRLEALSPCNYRKDAYKGQIAGHDINVHISGYGCERSAGKMIEIVAEPPSILIITGFAAALDESLATSDIVAATSATDAIATHICNQQLIQCAEALKDRRRKQPVLGRIFTSPEPICTPIEKVKLAQRQNCIAVDMETASAAALAVEKGIPFIAIRSILDRRDDEIPTSLTAALSPDGTPHLRKIIAAVRSQPSLVGTLMELVLKSRKSQSTLAEFLVRYIQALDY